MIWNKTLAFASCYIPERKEYHTCYSYKEIDEINRLFLYVAWKYAYVNKPKLSNSLSDSESIKI